jgi:hypothetical protein
MPRARETAGISPEKLGMIADPRSGMTPRKLRLDAYRCD